MRIFRPLDLLNPSLFFLVYYFFYLMLVNILNVIFDGEIIRFNVFLDTYYIICLFAFLFFLSSYIITPLIFNYTPFHVGHFRCDLILSRVWLAAVILIFLGIFIHCAYYIKLGFIPLLHENAALVRVSAKKGFGGYLLMANGAMYAGVLLLAYAYKTTNNLSKMICLLLVFISAAFIAGVGFRGPSAYLVMMFFLAQYFSSDKYVKRKAIPYIFLFYLSILIVFLSVVDYLRYGNPMSIDAFRQVFWTMTVNVYNLNNIVAGIESNRIDYLYGYSFLSDLFMVMPGVEGEFLGVQLVKMLGLSFEGEGMTVTAPGEAYINMGYPGIIIYSLLLGLIGELLFRWLLLPRTKSGIIILTFLSISFSKIVVGGVMPTLIFTLFPVCFFLLPTIMWCKE